MRSALSCIILMIFFLSGCRAGKSTVSQQDHVVVEIPAADSIKYAAVKEAFLNCDFVFKMSRIGDRNVNGVDRFLVCHDGKCQYQHFAGNPCGDEQYVPPTPRLIDGKLKKIKFSDKSKEYYKLTATIGLTRGESPEFSIMLYKNSDKAYGYLGSTYIEGWIEPYADAKIARGFKDMLLYP